MPQRFSRDFAPGPAAYHEGIGLDAIAGRYEGAHRATLHGDGGDVRAVDEPHAVSLQMAGQCAAEQQGVAAFVLRKVDPAGELQAALPQRGRQFDRRGGVERADLDAALAQEFSNADAAVERSLRAENLQRPHRRTIELQTGLGNECLVHVQAVAAEREIARRVASIAVRKRLEQKARAPAREARQRRRPDRQRRIRAPDPAEEMGAGVGAVPRIGLARGQHAAIGKAGAFARPVAPVHDRHRHAVASEPIGGGEPGETGADDCHRRHHDRSPAG